jgi:hypothetical protein
MVNKMEKMAFRKNTVYDSLSGELPIGIVFIVLEYIDSSEGIHNTESINVKVYDFIALRSPCTKENKFAYIYPR